MDKQFVADLSEKDTVGSVFLVKEKAVQVGKNGKTYMNLLLGDRTGQIDGKIWDNVEKWNEEFETDDFIFVSGHIQKYQGRLQLVVTSVECIMGPDVNLADFIPAAKRDPNEMFEELIELLGGIKNSFIKDLVLNTLNDKEIKPLFLLCPAAKSVHHAYLSGLLEHTLSICHVMKLISTHYKELDLDLLLFGAVFHDIGKIWELTFDKSIGYSDVGRLVGHIPLGSELVEKKASEIPNFPYQLKNICKHIVLAHHGQLEYGSPKRPKILEALVVNFIDDLDSKINSIGGLIKSEMADGVSWTRYSHMYDRYFYIDHFRAHEKLDK